MHYPFALPALPYSYDSLEPHIDALTMQIHHTKHHQAYIDNLNKAVEGYSALYSVDLGELLIGLDDLPADIKTAVRNHGGGHMNHTFFWQLMQPHGSRAHGAIADAITKSFGSFDAFQQQFNDASKKVFGSGWAWLCLDTQKKLRIITTSNQDSPIMQGLMPIMGLDVWEHAYYLKYQNRRPDYITAWWNVLNWERIEQNYVTLLD